jgi:hypothetical protein
MEAMMADDARAITSITPAQIAVMKRVAGDPRFRTSFFKDPARAVAGANLRIRAEELAPLSRINPDQYDSLQRLTSPGGAAGMAMGHTLAYAVLLAVAFALLLLAQDTSQTTHASS